MTAALSWQICQLLQLQSLLHRVLKLVQECKNMLAVNYWNATIGVFGAVPKSSSQNFHASSFLLVSNVHDMYLYF